KTKDSLKYKFLPVANGLLTFLVRATNDAQLILTKQKNEGDPKYRMVIGGILNTRSFIYHNQQESPVYSVSTPNILNGNEYREFWIIWTHFFIAIGQKGSCYPFMSFRDTNLFEVNYIGIRTCNGANGIWKFEENPGAICSLGFASDLRLNSESNFVCNAPRGLQVYETDGLVTGKYLCRTFTCFYELFPSPANPFASGKDIPMDDISQLNLAAGSEGSSNIQAAAAATSMPDPTGSEYSSGNQAIVSVANPVAPGKSGSAESSSLPCSAGSQHAASPNASTSANSNNPAAEKPGTSTTVSAAAKSIEINPSGSSNIQASAAATSMPDPTGSEYSSGNQAIVSVANPVAPGQSGSAESSSLLCSAGSQHAASPNASTSGNINNSAAERPPRPPPNDPNPQVERNIWVPASHGEVPPNATVGGYDNRESLYIARARHNNELIPGKLQPSRGCCLISRCLLEHRRRHYEVLCNSDGHWETWRGVVPPNAIPGGYGTFGETLYIGRAAHLGTLTPGKILNGVCFIPFFFREVPYFVFEIFVS
uniref:Farnesoic acid O-methyl transferase domain-containing protein n=1 Tax=Stomoxys calcitrans TaxID=35570 RepID=A0A1I8PH48_STOCA